MDKEKLSKFKEDYQRLRSLSTSFSAAMGVSAGMFGSYVVYEQFNDTGNYGILWQALTFLVGYFGLSAKIQARKEITEKKRDIEMLIRDIETYYGPL